MKKVIISVGIILCVFIILVLVFLNFKKTNNTETIANDTYKIKTEHFELDDLDFITFYIEDNNGNVVFVSDESWRTWDFKDIYFISDTNNICVFSADIGTTIYKFNGETWIPEDIQGNKIGDGSTGQETVYPE